MVIIEKYSTDIAADGFIIIQSKETCGCPICGGELRVRDSKKRRVINQAGDIDMYRLRRLKCKNCGKLHTEIPDCIVPYKHYAAEVVEAELLETRKDCPADNNTTSRWKAIFAAVLSLAHKYGFFSSQSYWVSKAYLTMEKLKLLTHPPCVPFASVRCYNFV